MSNEVTVAKTSNQVSQVIATIETQAFKDQLKSLLPTHVKVDQFLSVARRGIHGNKALNFQTMDKATLYSSILKASEQGMKLDGEEGALVQYGSSVQFMKMIKGVKKQLRNSGEIKEISAEVVYQNDKFEFWIDDEGKHLKHTPNFMSDRGEPMAAYSVITTKDGGRFITVMSKHEIEAVQSASKTGKTNFSPWNGPFKTEMWKKSVLRRNAKDAPSSTDLSGVFEDWDKDFDFSATNSQQAAIKSSSSVSAVSNPTKKKSRLEKLTASQLPELPKEEEAQEDLTNSEQNFEFDSSEIPI